MLYITRKQGQSVYINDVELVVISVSGNSVKLGFSYPKGNTILRKEVRERIIQENIEASNSIIENLDIPENISMINKKNEHD